MAAAPPRRRPHRAGRLPGAGGRLHVIDLTPTPLKEWAIRTFGTARQDDPGRLGPRRRARARRPSPGSSPGAAFASAPACCSCWSASPASAALTGPAAELARPAARRWPPRSPASARCGVLAAARAGRAPHRRCRPSDAGATGPSRRGVLIAGAARSPRPRRPMGGAGRWITHVPHPAGRTSTLPAAADPRAGASRRARDSRSPASRRSGRRTTTSTASTPRLTLPSSTSTTGR